MRDMWDTKYWAGDTASCHSGLEGSCLLVKGFSGTGTGQALLVPFVHPAAQSFVILRGCEQFADVSLPCPAVHQTMAWLIPVIRF